MGNVRIVDHGSKLPREIYSGQFESKKELKKLMFYLKGRPRLEMIVEFITYKKYNNESNNV
jgi:hypothetical protein